MNVFIVMAILDIDVVKSAFIGVFSYSSKSVQSKILLCFLFRKNIEDIDIAKNYIWSTVN